MTDELSGQARQQGQPFFAPLIERARGGDAAAFDQLMVLSERRVVLTAWRLLGHEEDARDAAQEVFLRAYKYLGRFKQEHDFQAWLYRITINVCRDIARKRGSRAGQFTSLEAEGGAIAAALASTDDTEERAILAQQRALVARALALLPEKERAALVLRDLEGHSTEEVARILGSRPATVRSQVCSARAKIKLFCLRFLQGAPGG